MFSHTHCHSEFSALDGLSTCKEIAKRAKKIGCESIALTDHGNVSGHLAFSEACRAEDVRPIFGMEAYHGRYPTSHSWDRNQRDQAHLVLGALTNQGLRNLWKISSVSAGNFRFVPRVNWDILEEYNEGLFCTSACLQSLVCQEATEEKYEALEKYLRIFGERFFIELHTYPSERQRHLNEALATLAYEKGLPVIFACDAHYCNPHEAPIWMADLSFRSLGEVKIGDEVIGWGDPESGVSSHTGKQRTRCVLKKSTVLAISRRNADIVKVTMESGRVIRCTPDHRWLTASQGQLKEYFGNPRIGRQLVRVIDPTPKLPSQLANDAAWLGGFFDGEGCVGKGRLTMSQSLKRSSVLERLEGVLQSLKFDYSIQDRDGHGKYVSNRCKVYALRGGRQALVDFANWCNPSRRGDFSPAIFGTQWRKPDRIVSIEPDGNGEVFGLTTTTGNYIAWGYASKNSCKEDYPIHDAYLAMQTGETLAVPIEERKMWHPLALYIQDENEIRDNLNYLPDGVVQAALDNSGALAQQVEAELPAIRRHLPVFVPADCPYLSDKDADAQTTLLSLVGQGIAEKYPEPERAYAQAIEEFDIFTKSGLEHYLLMTWDLISFCDQEGITVGPGRGSGAASVLNYALGITKIDPLKYDLYFERFFNEGRDKGFPDIDLDFPVAKRELVRKYLVKRWGDGRVRNIGTVTRMKPKMALDKTYKVCGITFDELDTVKGMLGQVPDLEILGVTHFGWSREFDDSKESYVLDYIGDDLENWINRHNAERQAILRQWLALAGFVCGRVFTYGIHPSGIVVSDVELDEELPCAVRGKDKILVTQFPMTDVEKRMFVKEDVLGLRNLDTLDEWETLVDLKLDWDNINEEDCHEEMWQLLDRGLTLGIFQIEDGSARPLAKRLQPRSLYELGIIVALNRPGPLRSGATESYVFRKLGQEKITYDHPLLEPILKDTFGVIVFQEQIIRFFEALGYTKQQADSVRAILGKKKPKEMDSLLKGKGEWKGISYPSLSVPKLGKRASELIWNKLLDYTKYSFNAPHALSYGVLAFRTLFAKYYASEEFMVACIRTNPDDAGLYVAEARRMGITVGPPDIQRSQLDVARVGDEILFGLSNIKWVGKATAKRLIEWREGADITTPEALRATIEAEQKRWEEGGKVGLSPRTIVKKSAIDHLSNAGAFDNHLPRQISMNKRQELERTYLQLVLSDDSKEIFEKYLTRVKNKDSICFSYEDAENQDRSLVPGIVADIRKTKVKKSGAEMAFVTLEYNLEQLKAAIFPGEWAHYQSQMHKGALGLFSINHNPRGFSLREVKFF